jgi:hypothetical protein
MSSITEKEKNLIINKLKELVELEQLENDLKNEKKKFTQNIKDVRPEVGETLESANRTRAKVNATKMQVSRVARSNHRKPTLENAYLAVNTVLGAEAVEKIKEYVKQDRLKRKEQCQVQDTISIIPVKGLRKPRKDKKPPLADDDNNNHVEKKKKVKFLKRKQVKTE